MLKSMNLYVKKYEFTSSFVHMNSYVSDWYIKKWPLTEEVGGWVELTQRPVVWVQIPNFFIFFCISKFCYFSNLYIYKT